MKFPPDDAGKKFRRSVADHEALTEIADPYEVPTNSEEPHKALSGTQQKLKIQDELKRLHVLINEMETRRLASRELLHNMIDELETRIKFAFPEADFVRHHAEHLGAKEDREFWKRMRITTGMAAFWVGLAMLLLFAFTGRK